MSSFDKQGVFAPPSPPIYANRQAEMAVVFLSLTAEDFFGDLLERVEPRDFMYDDCRFIFAEIVAMHGAGVPLCDKAAQFAWFQKPDVVRRMRQHKLDCFFVDGNLAGEPLPFVAMHEIALDGSFGTVAHLDWYVHELRKWRVRRGLRALSLDLEKVADEYEAAEGLAWLANRLGQLQQVAAPIMPKEPANA